MIETIGGQNYYYWYWDGMRNDRLPIYNSAYSFWDDPKEDIYTLEDGEPIDK